MRVFKWATENPLEAGFISAVIIFSGLVLTAGIADLRKPERPVAVTRPLKADWGGEGVLLAAPKDGPDRRATWGAFPDTLSVVFSDERVAREFYDEAVSNGERVCLSDLGPQRAEHHGQRWWLFTC